MAEKMTGMEIMLNSLFKLAGFDPKTVGDGVGKTVEFFKNEMTALRADISQINARLERIEKVLAITEEKGDTPRLPHQPDA